MRDIKFRAWAKYGEMLNNVQNHIGNDSWAFGNILKSDEFVVMQFTGLKDKSGVEIYEGDILSSGAASYLVDICGYYSHASVGFGVNYSKDGDTSEFSIEPNPFGVEPTLSVIGNIHENPELLD